jgi:hypothetical protein
MALFCLGDRKTVMQRCGGLQRHRWRAVSHCLQHANPCCRALQGSFTMPTIPLGILKALMEKCSVTASGR